MPIKKYSPKEIIKLLRPVKIEPGQRKTTSHACMDLGFSERSYYRWRKACGGLKISQAKHLKEMEKENASEELVVDLSLDYLASSASLLG